MPLWWESEQRQSQRSVTLLQVDLGGHSAWTAQAKTVYDACRSRAKFADILETNLSFEGFDRLFWAGDGGVFASRPNTRGFPENVCAAADTAFKTFVEWKKIDWDLHLRITATFLQVLVDPDPAHWCSIDFNTFLKYERDISLRNAFVITQNLQSQLTDSAESERFTKARRVRLPNGDHMTVYTDSVHSGDTEKTEQSLGHWLRDAVEAKHIPKAAVKERSFITIGNCTVLDTAIESHGYSDIALEPQQSDPTFTGISEEDRADWDTYRKSLVAANVRGVSTQVTCLVQEVSDDRVRLKYRLVNYSDARAFLQLMESKPGSSQRYRPTALEVVNEGTNIPNILSTAVVVIIGDFASPLLLLANRKGRTGGFDPDCWAVSIGEQFMPVTGLRGNREISADLTIAQSVERGLREELLGTEFSSKLNISIHAFAVEDLINSYMFIAVADLRPLRFDELARYWQKAIDQAEHNAIAGLPVNNTRLLDCMRGDGLPADAWSDIARQNLFRLRPGVTKIQGHDWQRNSHIRLATCYWYLKNQLK